MTDDQFFQQHPDRRARIRLPVKTPHVDRQRSMRYLDEEELAFRSLGPHDTRRRRIILYRVPKQNPMFDDKSPQILKIPFLLNGDETVEDRDDILLPIVHEIMMNAAKGML